MKRNLQQVLLCMGSITYILWRIETVTQAIQTGEMALVTSET